jgi:hypothetical protein
MSLPMWLLLVVVSSAAYFGRRPRRHMRVIPQPALIALTFVLVALCGDALVAGGNLSPGVCEDRDNRWVVAVFAIILLLDAYLPA